jgi:signal transduction histidine kinase
VGSRRAGLSRLLVLGLLVLFLAAETRPVPAGEARPPQRVLILYSERLELPGVVRVDQSIRSNLTNRPDVPLEVHSESLDVARFPDESQQRIKRDFLRRRYASKTPDVIITVGEAALDFLVQHRESLFPGTPVVASTPGEAVPPRQPWITGLVVHPRMRPSFDLILRLHPDTRRLVIAAGASPTDRYWVERAKSELREATATVEIVDLTGLSMPRILETVAVQPPHTVIFYLHVLRDGAGRLFVPRDALASIARVANAPVYGRYEILLGYGIVGGHLYSFDRHGAELARLAGRVLRGERTEAVTAVPSAADAYAFDWRQLRRWGIDEQRLPPGSVVRFRESSVWAQYKWHIAGAVGLIVVQSGLIGGLLVNRAWRRAAEEDARRQREQLAHVLRTATLGELTASLAHDLNQPLTAIATNTQAALRFLGGADGQTTEIREALTDIVGDARRAAQIVQRLRSLFRKEPVKTVAVDVNALIREIVGLLHADVVRRRISVRFGLSEALPPVFGDPVQFQQVVLNLIVNACEAIDTAPPGPRTILIETTQRDSGRLIIAVRDSGIGVKASDLELIFEHFVTSKPQGLGMGLAISRSIVQAHGGRIWASVNDDRGLTIHVQLPCGPRPIATAEAAPGAARPGAPSAA